MKKINSQIKYKNKKFKITIGTTDKKSPKTIYIGFGGYITPINQEESYVKPIRVFNLRMRKNVEKIVSNGKLTDRNIIFVSDIAEERICVNKKTYLDLQIYIPISNSILTKYNQNFKNISSMIQEKYIQEISDKIISTMKDCEFECTNLKE